MKNEEFSPAIISAMQKIAAAKSKTSSNALDAAKLKNAIKNEWDISVLQELEDMIEERLYFLKKLIDTINSKRIKGFGKSISGLKE